MTTCGWLCPIRTSNDCISSLTAWLFEWIRAIIWGNTTNHVLILTCVNPFCNAIWTSDVAPWLNHKVSRRSISWNKEQTFRWQELMELLGACLQWKNFPLCVSTSQFWFSKFQYEHKLWFPFLFFYFSRKMENFPFDEHAPDASNSWLSCPQAWLNTSQVWRSTSEKKPMGLNYLLS